METSRKERGSVLLIAMMMLSFLGAIAVAVFNPVTTSNELIYEYSAESVALMIAETAIERTKSIVSRDTIQPDANGVVQEATSQPVLNSGWLTSTVDTDPSSIDAYVDYPVIDQIDLNTGAPVFDTALADPNFPQPGEINGTPCTYIVYTTVDPTNVYATTYVSVEYDGAVKNIMVSYIRTEVPKYDTIFPPNPLFNKFNENKAAFGKNGLTMGGVKFTDSYNSDKGAYGGGNVGKLGDIGSDAKLDTSGGVVNGKGWVTDMANWTGSTKPTEGMDTKEEAEMPEIMFPDEDPATTGWNPVYKSSTLGGTDPGMPAPPVAKPPTTIITMTEKIKGITTTVKKEVLADALGNPLFNSKGSPIIYDPAAIKPSVTSYGPGDIYVSGDVVLSGTGGQIQLVAPCRIIIEGDYQITGQGLISIFKTKPEDDVVIFHRGSDVKISGNGVSNPGAPGDFRVNSTAATGFVGGTADFYGVLYMPKGHIKATGDTSVFGALIGDTIDIFGNAKNGVHFDEALLAKDTQDDFKDTTTGEKVLTGVERTGTFTQTGYQVLD